MRSRVSRRVYAFFIALIVFGSGGASIVQAEVAEHGINIEDMDLSVSPGEDFYRFANGGWEDNNEIPGTSATYGVSEEVDKKVTSELMDLIGDLDADTTTDSGKMKSLYDQFIDEDQRDEDGIAPLQPILDRIQDIETVSDAMKFQESAQLDGLGIFELMAYPALDDATQYIGWITGPTYSLPSSAYYLDSSDDSEAIRQAWIETTAEMLVILGYDEDEATDAATAALEFETQLLLQSSTMAQMEDPQSQNNPVTVKELDKLLPGFDWASWLTALGLDADAPLNIYDINWMEGLAGVLDETDAETLRNFFTVQLVWGNAAYVSIDIADLSFAFNSGTLNGITERLPIKERGVYLLERLMPEVLGQIYVDEAFPPESKEAITELVDNIIIAFGERIRASEWMSDETKEKALEKLELLEVLVGYPEVWKTYDDVEIGETLFDSVHSAEQATIKADLAKIGGPVDRGEWYMGAYEVNAYYDPQVNTIVFPAGILQAPFFDPEADPASNYGAIGAVIGHEITHAFDLSGADYDGYGNAVNWWSEADLGAFEDLNDLVIDQYSEIEAVPDVYVDGYYTVTENVADLGGVQVAYDAMLVAIGEDAEFDGPWFLSQQQRFFIAYATSWRQMARPEYIENLVLTDSHAPSFIRAVQPLRNMDEFYEAFDITEDDAEWLAPEDRIVIW